MNIAKVSGFATRPFKLLRTTKHLLGKKRILDLRNFCSNLPNTDETNNVKSVKNILKLIKLSNIAYFMKSNQSDLDSQWQSVDQSLLSMSDDEIQSLDNKRSKKRVPREKPYEMFEEIADDSHETNDNKFPFLCEQEGLPESVFSHSNDWTLNESRSKEEIVAELQQKLKLDNDYPPKSVTHILTLASESVPSSIAKKDPGDKTWRYLGDEIQPYLVEHLSTGEKTLPEPSLSPEFFGYWKSIKAILPNFHKVVAVDLQTEHPFLKYTATADLICYYKEELTVVCWKPMFGHLSNRIISSKPIEVVACIGSLNFDPHFQMIVTKGIVVIPYVSGVPAHILEFNPETYWENWIKKLRAFYNT